MSVNRENHNINEPRDPGIDHLKKRSTETLTRPEKRGREQPDDVPREDKDPVTKLNIYENEEQPKPVEKT